MMVLGLLGGMSDYSAKFYLELVDRCLVGERRLPYVVAPMDEVQRVGACARNEDWNGATEAILDAVRKLRRAGADFLAIPSLTPHRMADVLQKETGVPVLRLDDCIVEEVAKLDKQRIALLSANIVGEEFLCGLQRRLEESAQGRKVVYLQRAEQVEFNRLTLANMDCNKETKRKQVWTYLEAIFGLENQVDLILNGSVEMVRMLGLENARLVTSNRAAVACVVDWHIAAIVQAIRGERKF